MTVGLKKSLEYVTKPGATVTHPAHDFLRSEHHPLDAIFSPSSVAVIGATEKLGSVGRTILWNLVTSPFGGTVFPIHPTRPSVLGIRAYPSISAVSEQVELAVIATPATTVPGIIKECVDSGVKGAIIISAGFKETGPAGVELEAQVLAEARRGRMRIIGPNCFGVMMPLTGMNATFSQEIARPGKIAFVSQSGALCAAILDWSLREQVGFSAFVSVGSMLDVGWGDLIYYLGDDPRTTSILIYMESVGDARSFLSAAREVALTKPIIIIKPGRTEEAAKAAASHTGSMTGSDEVLAAAFRRSGVLRVQTIDDLFNMAEVLARQPRPKGPRLAIVTNAGGPGVLAADAVAPNGELAQLTPETISALNAVLSPHWSHNNPIDVLGDATPEAYTKAVELAIMDPNTDGVLPILAPQGMTGPSETAELMKQFANVGKPIIASWMGGTGVAVGEAVLKRANIPTFPYPETAVRVFNYMWRYSYNLRGLYETPVLSAGSEEGAPDRVTANKIIDSVRARRRTLLTEPESKQLLAAYGVPVVETRIAHNADEAAGIAGQIGYPVVLKVFSEVISHKTDIGGVKLSLADESAVRHAYASIQRSVSERMGPEHFHGVTVQPMVDLEGFELIVGCSLDPQFGPVLLFGAGGHMVEVFGDRALALPPLNTILARRMMEQTRVYKALGGFRGHKAVNVAALEELLVRFSQLVVEQPWIKEIDINPLLASAERIVALDARVVVHGPEVAESQLPKPAIRPYPVQYVQRWTMKNGMEVTIRPIRPEDEPLMVKFHETLSERSVYLRYFNALKLGQRTAHDRLTRICFLDFDREMALVAVHRDPDTGNAEILGVGRLSKQHSVNEAEFAVLISDLYQRQGLGTELLRRMLDFARDEKLTRVVGSFLDENHEMQHISAKLGMKLHRSMDEALVKAFIDL
jgi:acetyltransferase